MRHVLAVSMAVALFGGCGQIQDQGSSLKLRDLTTAEAQSDFNEIVTKVRTSYGPLEFKEQRFQYSLEDLIAQTRTEIDTAKNDGEIFGAYARFLAQFKDGHVGISFVDNANPIARFEIPLFLTPVEDKALVASVGPELDFLGIKVGDEVTAVDGKNPFELAEIFARYDSFGNDLSDRHLMYQIFRRSFFVQELIPTKDTVELELTRADGTTYSASATWKIKKRVDQDHQFVTDLGDAEVSVVKASDYNAASQGSILDFGAVKPFFINDQTSARYGIVEAKPSDAMLSKYGVDLAKVPPIYSGLYNYEGKTILLIRQSGYMAEEGFTNEQYIQTYRAILDQWDDFADVLVIDQTHNPGGSVRYVTDFFRLFIKGETGPNFVQANRADRVWINAFKEWAKEIDPELKKEEALKILAHSKTIETAYDAGEFLARPVPFDVAPTLKPDDQYTWKKPVLVLANELAGSGGDAFPMVMQRSQTAKIFGQRTMGLGGSVEEVVQLTHSQASVRLTRGLFSAYREQGNYTVDQWIENNGVTPDLPHIITVDDFRADFVGYVEAFSKAAVQQ